METIDNITEQKVIQNSDVLYRSDIKWVDDVEPKPINDFEKEMLKDSLSAEQLLEKEKEEKPIVLTTEEHRKQHIMKVKVISLDKMGKAPLMNPSLFSKKEKEELIKHMEETLQLTEDVITELFNEVCLRRIFTDKADYSTFPVYSKLA